MVENFINLKNDILDLWNDFDKKTKIIIVTALIGTMVGILVLANWASQPDYDVLFKNLVPEDSGAIVEQLREKNVSYRLKDGGRTILVPRQNVYELRVELASGDLPTGGVTGFEIFDQTSIGATDFEQQVNYQRALSGELTRTIRQIENIEYAEVQITPRRDSIYLENEEPAKASVMIGLKPNTQLDVARIRGIANLVASGVEGLNPSKVTIVDSRGNLLSAKLEEDEGFDFNGDQLELRRRVESDIQRNLRMMLTRVFGPDNFAVTVNAELNFDKQDSISKVYEPVVDDEGIVRSEQGFRENQEGRRTESGGVPGTSSNIPEYEAEDGDYESYEAEEWTRNYEINERVENLVKSPGTMERLSVSVMVNQNLLDDDNTESIRDAIEAAVGYNAQRGDRISVTSVQFDDSLEQLIAERRAEEQAQRDRLIRFIGIIIVVLVVIVVLIFRRQRGTQEATQKTEVPEGVDYTVADQAEEEITATDQLSEEEQERRRILGDIRELVTDQPEEVAELIKSWLAED